MRQRWIRTWLAAAVAAGCAGGKETTDTATTEPSECGGLGEASIEIGGGGLRGFEPWTDGGIVPVVDDGTGRYGFQVELLTTGLDTTAPIITLLRFRVGDDPTTEDVGASLSLQCPEEGPGWAGVFVPLDDAYQDPGAVAGLDGAAMVLTALMTDQTDETAERELTLELAAL